MRTLLLLLAAGSVLLAGGQTPPPVTATAGTTYTVKDRLGEIDWQALKPGDTVVIPWKEGGYHERLVVAARGAADAWITIKGTPGPKGELPVIDGGNATTDPQFALSYLPAEASGLVTVWRTAKSGNVRPCYLRFDGLRVQGANSDRSDPGLTGSDGKAATWGASASGFYLLGCDHVVISGCEVTDCGNGIFSADSTGNVCSDLLLENNRIWGHGKVGSDKQHNTYVQSAGVIYRGNTYGPVRTGSGGGALKDRSADVMIEGNTIEASGRQIDLSSWQEDVASRQKMGNATRSIIRNNVLINRTSARMVYVEGRTLPDGTGDKVEFTNNTCVVRSDAYYVKAFMSEYSKAATFTVSGNLFDVAPLAGAKVPEFRMADSKGAFLFGANWSRPKPSQYAYVPADRTVDTWDKFVTGTTAPGFVDEAKGDYRLTADAAAKGYGADVPTPPPAPPAPPAVVWVEVKRTRIEDGETAVETVLYRRK